MQVPVEDLQQASTLLLQALKLRQKYMNYANQSFPAITARFLKPRNEHWFNSDIDDFEGKLKTVKII